MLRKNLEKATRLSEQITKLESTLEKDIEIIIYVRFPVNTVQLNETNSYFSRTKVKEMEATIATAFIRPLMLKTLIEKQDEYDQLNNE